MIEIRGVFLFTTFHLALLQAFGRGRGGVLERSVQSLSLAIMDDNKFHTALFERVYALFVFLCLAIK